MNWWTLLLTVGATARITRLITADTITAFARRWAATIDAKTRLRRALATPSVVRIPPPEQQDITARVAVEPPGALLGFLTCPWCVSMWIGFAAVAAVLHSHGQAHRCVLYTFAALTASAVTGELAARRPN